MTVKALDLTPRPEAKDNNLPWVYWSSAETSKWRNFMSFFEFFGALIILLEIRGIFPSCQTGIRSTHLAWKTPDEMLLSSGHLSSHAFAWSDTQQLQTSEDCARIQECHPFVLCRWMLCDSKRLSRGRGIRTWKRIIKMLQALYQCMDEISQASELQLLWSIQYVHVMPNVCVYIYIHRYDRRKFGS